MRRPSTLFRAAFASCVALLLAGCNRNDNDQQRRAAAQRPTVVVYTLVSYPILDQSIAGIKAGLNKAGFDSTRVRLVDVSANGEMDKVPAFAREVIASNPTLIIPVSTPVAQAVVKEGGASHRILYSTVTNPSDIGIPQGATNVTGVSDAVNYEANLDLIKELFPRAKRIGIVYNASERNSQFGVDEVKRLAPARGLTITLSAIARSDEVPNAVSAMAGRVDVLYVGSDNTVVSALAGLLKIAAERRIPVIASDEGSVEQGALAAVSVDYLALGEKVGEIAAELLRSGNAPGEISAVRFVGNKLVLNTKGATALSYTFPDAVRKRAAHIY